MRTGHLYVSALAKSGVLDAMKSCALRILPLISVLDIENQKHGGHYDTQNGAACKNGINC